MRKVETTLRFYVDEKTFSNPEFQKLLKEEQQKLKTLEQELLEKLADPDNSEIPKILKRNAKEVSLKLTWR